jgi:hypothetical protein
MSQIRYGSNFKLYIISFLILITNLTENLTKGMSEPAQDQLAKKEVNSLSNFIYPSKKIDENSKN